MKHQAVLQLAAVILVLVTTWELTINSFHVQDKAKSIFGLYEFDQMKAELQTTTTTPKPKCSLSRVCPPDHFAVNVRSGAADIVGPKICFDGKIIMSHLFNNVGPGLNIVVVNGENGVVDKFGHFDMTNGKPEEIMAFLKEIKPGTIVLVASFDDVTAKMTTEMREIFIGMGSTLINSVKHRDGWVFVGRAGAENSTLFEKHAVNDETNNIYEGWPRMIEVAGCFPKTLTEG